MNDQVITPEELAAAHAEALQLNSRYDFFVSAKEQGFSELFTQSILSAFQGEWWSANRYLETIWPDAMKEDANRQQASA